MKKENKLGSLMLVNPLNYPAIDLLYGHILSNRFNQEETILARHLTWMFVQLGIQKNIFNIPHRLFRYEDFKTWERNYQSFKSRRYWTCHIAAPYSVEFNDDLEYVFGFMTQDLGETQVTLLHSFNVDIKTQQVLDPYAEIKIFESAQDNGVGNITFKDFHSYQGIIIPKKIALDVLYSDGDGKKTLCNMWGFIKNHILPDFDKVKDFVKIVENKGVGWDIKNFPPLSF